MKRASGYSKRQWEQIRSHLAEKAKEYQSLVVFAAFIGMKANTLTSFLLGRSKGLSQQAIEQVIARGLMPIFVEYRPVDWTGKTTSVREAAREKGVCHSTIRNWIRGGKMTRVSAPGKKIRIAVDEFYAAVSPREKAVLREEISEKNSRIADLESQISKLLGEVESLKKENSALRQAEFSWFPVISPERDLEEISVEFARCACGCVLSGPQSVLSGKCFFCRHQEQEDERMAN